MSGPAAKKAGSLPVLMYHFISNQRDKLAIGPERFEELGRLTAAQGWRGVGLREAEEFFLHGAPLPKKSFLITLDDGYLDNYVNAWPILRKYGHQAVIFATAAMLEPGNPPGPVAPTGQTGTTSLRPSLEDVWSGRAAAADLPPIDTPLQDDGLGNSVRRDLFLNWNEARLLEASGVISLGGHSLRHQAVFTGPEYNGFFQPGPETTPFDREVPGTIWGLPRFKAEAELHSRAFLPAEDLLEAVARLVPQERAAAHEFFQHESNLAALRKLVETQAAKPGQASGANSLSGTGQPNGLGRFESDEEQYQRLSGLMRETQAILQRELGHPCRSFCWPWGKSCALAQKCGREAGFEVFYNVGPGVNLPGRAGQTDQMGQTERAAGINRMNAKRDPQKLLSRLNIYSRPWLGRLYKMFRM